MQNRLLGQRRVGFGWLLWPLGITAVIAVVWFVIFGVVWLISLIPGNQASIARDHLAMIHNLLFPGGIPTPAFWLYAIVMVAIMLFLFAYNSDSDLLGLLARFVAVALILGGISLGIYKLLAYNNIAADYYLSTTTLKVADTSKLPNMLLKYADNGTLKLKVEQGDLPTSWVPRVASATGALNVMKKTSDAVNNTDLMEDTATYLYGSGNNGTWTAIRNGTGQQSIYGIASWNGTGDRVDTCRFSGDYALDYAFNGTYHHDLWNVVAATYGSFYYNQGDMWGYCKDGEPIIVLPGVQLGSTDMQSADKTAGVLTIQGSPSGEPIVTLHADVKPGEFPGPVYAQRLVDNQREALDFGAGYWQAVNEHFGFDVTNVESQLGNNSDYLMKNETDGRLYWVTPMKPQGTQSQTLIAYTMIPADEVSSSTLNSQTVYVLNEDDSRSRVVNLDDLMKRVKSSTCEIDTNFCGENATGNIIEFLPVSDTNWQVFGEIGGRVKYKIDVAVDSRITPSIVDVSTDAAVNPSTTGQGSTPDPTGAAGCNTPSTLTDQQLADCLAELVKELSTRSTKK